MYLQTCASVASLLTARCYIATMALEITPEEYNSTRLPLDNTVEINKKRLLDQTSEDVSQELCTKEIIWIIEIIGFIERNRLLNKLCSTSQ